MKYQGYKTREEIISLVEIAFPYIEKPVESELMFLGDEDLPTKFIKEHLIPTTKSGHPKNG
jgi:hypothetical protein